MSCLNLGRHLCRGFTDDLDQADECERQFFVLIEIGPHMSFYESGRLVACIKHVTNSYDVTLLRHTRPLPLQRLPAGSIGSDSPRCEDPPGVARSPSVHRPSVHRQTPGCDRVETPREGRCHFPEMGFRLPWIQTPGADGRDTYGIHLSRRALPPAEKAGSSLYYSWSCDHEDWMPHNRMKYMTSMFGVNEHKSPRTAGFYAERKR